MLYIPQTISGGGGLKVWDVVVQGTGGAVGGLQALGTTKLVIAEIGGAGHVATPRPGAYQMVDVVQKVKQVTQKYAAFHHCSLSVRAWRHCHGPWLGVRAGAHSSLCRSPPRWMRDESILNSSKMIAC